MLCTIYNECFIRESRCNVKFIDLQYNDTIPQLNFLYNILFITYPAFVYCTIDRCYSFTPSLYYYFLFYFYKSRTTLDNVIEKIPIII